MAKFSAANQEILLTDNPTDANLRAQERPYARHEQRKDWHWCGFPGVLCLGCASVSGTLWRAAGAARCPLPQAHYMERPNSFTNSAKSSAGSGRL